MKQRGEYMRFFGIGSIGRNFFNVQFSRLAWIDSWGESVGWAIRIGLIVVGGAIWAFEKKRQAAAV